MWYPHDVHYYRSSRSERVRTNIFCGKSKCDRSHLLGLSPDDGNDIQGAIRAETLRVRIVSDWGGGVASVLSLKKSSIVVGDN